ncbi:MAG: 50S ribosomal protein L4 [Nitrospiraceae bacterium]|nr:MAG: 50S ribosomal protein L4 [Nitrospiraceae bacterium]
MPTIDVVDLNRRKVGVAELRPDVFGAEVNGPVLHEVVLQQQAGLRQGTASTKTRGLVSGSGRKPYKQKHTGRARAGSIRSPLWRHGGIVFGPLPRDYGYTMPKKKTRGAVRSALSVKVREGGLLVLEDLPQTDGKTRSIASMLKALGLGGKTLIVAGGDQDRLRRAAKNIPDVTVIAPEGVNVRDLLVHDAVLIARRDLSRLEEAFA